MRMLVRIYGEDLEEMFYRIKGVTGFVGSSFCRIQEKFIYISITYRIILVHRSIIIS